MRSSCLGTNMRMPPVDVCDVYYDNRRVCRQGICQSVSEKLTSSAGLTLNRRNQSGTFLVMLRSATVRTSQAPLARTIRFPGALRERIVSDAENAPTGRRTIGAACAQSRSRNRVGPRFLLFATSPCERPGAVRYAFR